ncbi:MAG: AMP-binding protein, partial [Planctomycetota bacterium]
MDRVQGMPDATAIIDYRGGKPRTLSFEELDRSAGQLAALLRQTGLQTGETVLILCPMSAELYLMLAAIFRLGLVALFLDPSTPREQLESSLKGRLPRALFGGRAVQAWRWVNPMRRRIPFRFCTAAGIPGTIPLRYAARLEPLSEIAACSNETPALITFTSGTGSQPKA